jgi:hypothetical protein
MTTAMLVYTAIVLRVGSSLHMFRLLRARRSHARSIHKAPKP